MQSTYLFYDLETSGLNRCFDQVVQFAAIRTDLDLNELERHEIFIKLNPDVVPSPGAFLTHKISLDKLQDGECEYDAIKEIHRLFNTPGTITIGYNTLGFDDEFLRFSFYRNLLDPYSHQYANGCYRMDIYPMAVVYYLFKPDILLWPKLDGVATFKLEHLSAKNNLTSGNAHEAMSDVSATVALARCLKKDEEVWNYLGGCFNKKIDLARLEKIGFSSYGYQEALLTDGSFGSSRLYQAQVVGLGLHHHYKNQSLWLSLDQFQLDNSTLAKDTFCYRKRFGEPPILLPSNQRFGRHLNSDRLALASLNREWLKKNQSLFLEIANYHQEYKYPEIPDLDLDAALYQLSFMTDRERLSCNAFHRATLDNKLASAQNFSNPNLRSLAIRILGRNYPKVLARNGDLFAEFNRYLNRIKSSGVVVNYKNEQRLTKEGALAAIDSLLQTRELNDSEKLLLADLTKYIQSW